jgi:serine/threonine protein kinase
MGISKDIKDYFNMKDPQDPSGPKPIRWLAIEAMQNIKAATMSSDVWSYGVVCWEICTQAKTPYNSVKTAKLLKYLETGKVRCPSWNASWSAPSPVALDVVSPRSRSLTRSVSPHSHSVATVAA